MVELDGVGFPLGKADVDEGALRWDPSSFRRLKGGPPSRRTGFLGFRSV